MSVPRLNIGLGSFLVSLALVVAVGIGSAIAVIPDSGTYYACLTKKTGAIKVINYPKVKCASGQKLIKWNAKGPVGPAGPQGVQGPKGDQGSKGDQGPAGPADWNAIPNIPAGFGDGVDNQGVTSVKLTRVTGSPSFIGTGGVANAVADCPSGSSVAGGGHTVVSTTVPFNAVSFTLMTSTPRLDLTGWLVNGRNTGDAAVNLTAWAVCMSVEPAGAFTTAKKGLVPASVKKAMKKRDR